jgi:hypothetical protein
VIAEASADAVSVDVMGGESADGVMLMAKAGVIKPYPWVEVFGKELPGIAAAMYDDVPELKGCRCIISTPYPASRGIRR